ncbi:DUF7144 family membrane protein [Streptomyces chiangmaiensis]|uniref:DUF7144 domain-containing protein n=1 Tax=Streptomyces chiangmaiensis TaxID=766497 RepID=A0ABU7FVV3_9ACTN|nr:hypothetical protein [Streptomyces chiangmaiensis]MED7828246.1 hypothetical protein [Streptomyces chiangmaiensis]
MVQNTARTTAHPKRAAWSTGGTTFAGVLMIVGGVVGVLNGIAGIATNNVYVSVGNYVYEFSLTTWGWIHLIVGALVAITGWGVLQGMEWARATGVGLAALYMILYFMFLPYAPIWSIIAIAIGGFVIWSLVTADRTGTTG